MKIRVDVPDGKSGDWKVETFEVSKDDAKYFNMRCATNPLTRGREIEPGLYQKLEHKGSVIMSNTPAEISDHREFINKAKGSVLINGLGLGVALTAILAKKEVTDVTVIESSSDVMELVASTFANDPRVTILLKDAFEYKSPRGKKYDVVWHDIWPTISSDNLEEMTKLHRKYSHRAGWQGSWCKEECRAAKRSWN